MANDVVATFDTLLSPLVVLGALNGTVTCTTVWAHETDPTRLWAGFADGKVYQGTLDLVAQTATWSHVGTVPEGPIVEIRESYSTVGELRATAGQGYYYSGDGGSSWVQFDTGDTAWRMAGGFDQNAYSFLNDDNPLRFEDGHAPTFPVLIPPVRHIRGLTFGWRTQKLYCADDQARLFQSDDTFTTFSHVETAPSGVNHMVRSGNIDNVIYLATDAGAMKWMPDVRAPFYVRQTATPVEMIGIGPAHPPPIPYLLIAGWDNADPGGVSVWDAGTWTDKPLPVSGTAVRCNWIAAYDSTHWLALFNRFSAPTAGLQVDTSGSTVLGDGWAHSPLWYTADGGTTWSEVPLTKPGSGLAGTELMFHVEWNDTGTGWMTSLPSAAGGGGAYYTGAAGTADAPVSTPSRSLSYITAGVGGDFIIVQSNGSDKKAFYLPSGGSLVTPAGASLDYSHPGIDRLPGTQLFITIPSDGSLAGNDYKTAQPVTLLSGVNARYLTAATDALYFVDGTGALYRLVNPFGGGTPVFIQSDILNYVRTDRQSHTVVGAVNGGATTISVIVGGVSRTVAGPGATLSGALEVVTIP